MRCRLTRKRCEGRCRAKRIRRSDTTSQKWAKLDHSLGWAGTCDKTDARTGDACPRMGRRRSESSPLRRSHSMRGSGNVMVLHSGNLLPG
jgi:hypothetical protein